MWRPKVLFIYLTCRNTFFSYHPTSFHSTCGRDGDGLFRTGPKSKSSIFYVHLMKIPFRVEIQISFQGVGVCESNVCVCWLSLDCHNVKHFNWTALLRNEWKKSRNWSLLCHKSHPANNYYFTETNTFKYPANILDINNNYPVVCSL